jgi:hypothetical protein
MAPWAETCSDIVRPINSIMHSDMWVSWLVYCCLTEIKAQYIVLIHNRMHSLKIIKLFTRLFISVLYSSAFLDGLGFLVCSHSQIILSLIINLARSWHVSSDGTSACHKAATYIEKHNSEKKQTYTVHASIGIRIHDPSVPSGRRHFMPLNFFFKFA